MMRNVLVTGGCGFIGSNTVVCLSQNGYEPIIIDNFTNAKRSVVADIERLCGRAIKFYEGDVKDPFLLRTVFEENEVETVIHFAGLKAVGESVKNPLHYYQSNLGSTLTLLEAMTDAGCFHLIFSSSATVYGNPQYLPIDEAHPLQGTNPYGRTKLYQEEILRDLAMSDSRWRIALLRYFNPVGAHSSGSLGEDPSGVPNNLFPIILQVIQGLRAKVQVFGSDYSTPDGSGVRDYIHVSDLALGHVAALKKLDGMVGTKAINLGTGQGYSVLDVLDAFASILGHQIDYEIVERRPGDVPACFADSNMANSILGWRAMKTMNSAIKDSLRALKHESKITK